MMGNGKGRRFEKRVERVILENSENNNAKGGSNKITVNAIMHSLPN